MMKNMKLALLALALLVSAPVALFAAAAEEEDVAQEATNVQQLAKTMVEFGYNASDVADKDAITDEEIILIGQDPEGFMTAYISENDGEPMDTKFWNALKARVKTMGELREGRQATEAMKYTGGMFEEPSSYTSKLKEATAPAYKKSAPMAPTSGYTIANVNAIQPSKGVFNVNQIRQLRTIFDAAVAAGEKGLAKAAMDQASKSTSQTGVKSMRDIYNRM